MASALIGGLSGEDICIFDKNPAAYEKYEKAALSKAENIKEAVSYGDVIFLCVKPQNFDEILPQIAECPLDGKLIVSIAAGITLSRIEKALGEVPVIRTIPNTPLLIGKGVTGICRNTKVSDKMYSEICRLFSHLGEVINAGEDEINAITAATSSAPAYVYLFIKAIADAGRELGINEPNLTDRIADMVIGAATLLKGNEKSPDELIRMVTSPNGTTERAMKVFTDRDFTGIIAEAMLRCAERAKELSEA